MSYQNPHFPAEPDDDMQYTPVETELDALSDDDRIKAGKLMYNLDLEVGRLVSGLESAGIMDNAIMVFTSDNGPCRDYGLSAYPFRGAKNYTFEGGSHVRAFVTSTRLPESRLNTTYTGLFHVTDWVPTLMDMVVPGWSQTAAEASELDGFSQWPVLMGSDSEPRHEIIYNIQQDETTGNLTAAIRDGDWKYIWNEDCQVWYDYGGRYHNATYLDQCATHSSGCIMFTDPHSWLFNLKNDPYEITDLSAEFPEKVLEFQERLLAHSLNLRTAISEENEVSDNAGAFAAWTTNGCVSPWL
eukprot:TRINITY_DN778_c0_g1_i1.p1 TRINITY_DN778_c0_g1~~TRINITY_DN778_c0_g1_i1.p1  ORF type:complete len:299 (-),score=65.46 TRINITY_DN778_c0_g1_i1:888-1784(-)